MTYEEVVAMLEESGLPVAYDHFAEGESPDPPFLVFLFSDSNNMYADDAVYQEIDNLNIELYMDKKDPKLEKKIQKMGASSPSTSCSSSTAEATTPVQMAAPLGMSFLGLQ